MVDKNANEVIQIICFLCFLFVVAIDGMCILVNETHINFSYLELLFVMTNVLPMWKGSSFSLDLASNRNTISLGKKGSHIYMTYVMKSFNLSDLRIRGTLH